MKLQSLSWRPLINIRCSRLAAVTAVLILSALSPAFSNPVRARDLGIPFSGTPGKWNAITDVHGVEVGEISIISGSGPLEVGVGPVRTGVTVIFPRGKASGDQVFAGFFSLNGNGEMTGTHWVDESGFLAGPIAITNTVSVGTVRDAVIKWCLNHYQATMKKIGDPLYYSLPVVAETADVRLNDINGFHVTEKDAFEALDGAMSGPVPEGNTGGGTGMVCYQFKGGTGTSSRELSAKDGGYTVGVLVQANHGLRHQLMVAGVPVGREMPLPANLAKAPWANTEMGSIIVIIATDAPLLPNQLKRLARRATLGIARTGAVSANSSGDLFLAFSTANPGASEPWHVTNVSMLPNDRMDPLFEATIQATEEAVINALVAARTMTGINDTTIPAIDHQQLQDVLRKYHRLVAPASEATHSTAR